MTNDNNAYLLLVTDALTKFVKIYPVSDTKSSTTTREIEKFVLGYGLPKIIVSDRGTAFTGEEFKKFTDGNGIHHTLNSARHPQANGAVERCNRVILPMLMTTLNEDVWDQHILEMERDMNTAENNTTGTSAFEALYGFTPRFYDGKMREVTGTFPLFIN